MREGFGGIDDGAWPTFQSPPCSAFHGANLCLSNSLDVVVPVLPKKITEVCSPVVNVKCSSLYGPPVSYPAKALRDFKYLHGSSADAAKTSVRSITTAMRNAELVMLDSTYFDTKDGSEGQLAKYRHVTQ